MTADNPLIPAWYDVVVYPLVLASVLLLVIGLIILLLRTPEVVGAQAVAWAVAIVIVPFGGAFFLGYRILLRRNVDASVSHAIEP